VRKEGHTTHMGEIRNACNLEGLKGSNYLGDLKWYGIKMRLEEIGLHWIQLTHDRVQK
jgi:hypothetical protein